ncbi:type IV pilus secretin PilQ [Kushneria phosphatilytica]|uniref:Type IV pilus secretin PilQ n=1 Tax=Kushneria phosphatilytica TaxID=657387 RepID=A0A5C1A199_9GAMM|nr:type IV pilus secretin family protein [Kushneria phosphatilytica]QEL11928.1 type IV pilus secretin PilQ [Kushneria phosphatilytica]
MHAGRSPILLLLLVALSLLAGRVEAAALTGIDTRLLPDGRVLVALDFDAPPPEQRAWLTDNPARLVVDFPDSVSHMSERQVSVGRGGVSSITALNDAQRLRVVVALNQPLDWQIERQGNRLRLLLGERDMSTASQRSFLDRINTSEVATTAGGKLPRRLPDTDQSSGPVGPPAVTGFDFRKLPEGAGELRVHLDRGNVTPRLETHNDRVEIMLPDVMLPPAWRQILDVSDFATPVSRVTPERVAEGTRLTLAIAPGAAAVASQQGEDIAITVSAPDSSVARQRDQRFPFEGKRVSLNFQHIAVRAVLSILAEEVGLNLVVSDGVTGEVTLNLSDVPWDQALDLILRTHGLASQRRGNVLLVAPGGDLAEMAKRVADADRSVSDNAALTTQYLQMRYADAADMATLLRGDNGLGLLSSRGRISVDPRTNTLLVQDTRENIEQIRNTVDQLDVPVRQVQIEARIVIARDRVANRIGVRWGVSSRNQLGEDGVSVVDNSTGTGRAYGGLAVDYGDNATPTTNFGIGYLTGDVLLGLELNALESEGKSQTISQPKVITANRHTALIKQGQEIPYQENQGDTLTGSSIEFKEAVLSLEVTPQITPDDRIIMDLTVNNDDVSNTQYSGQPAIDTNQIQTRVLVSNGETVVLGGILSTEQLNNLSKTPFLGDLPGIGRLFRYSERSNEKVELLVFITPKIIEDTPAVN